MDQTGSFLAVEYGEQIAVFESRKMHEICTIEAPVSAERFKVMRWGPDARWLAVRLAPSGKDQLCPIYLFRVTRLVVHSA